MLRKSTRRTLAGLTRFRQVNQNEKLTSWFDRLGREKAGNVAPIFAAVLIPLVTAVGASVDYAGAFNLRTQVQAALDSAVLAAGREYQVSGDMAGAMTAASNRFDALVDHPSVSLTNVEVGQETGAVQLRAEGAYDTTFLAVAGYDQIQVGASAEATLANGGLDKDLEVSMMLDVTGSMSGSKISDLKLAAKDLVEIVVRDDQSEHSSRVALVPFAAAVNPGAMYEDLVWGAPSSKTIDGERYYLTNCVSERTTTRKYVDARPSRSDNAHMLGPVYTTNGSCKPGSSEVVPLSSDKELIKDAIDEMSASGWTGGHLGTAWAWYLLSPKWIGLLPAGNKPGAYDPNNLMKVAILMTDGEYNTQYVQGVDDKYVPGSAPNGSSNSQAVKLCTNMKNKGVIVYTIGFELDTASAIDVLEQCASDASHHFLAENGDELRQAFREIAFRIAQLRLSK